MTQPILNSPCIVTGVRQCVAAAVPQHVCMHREVGAGALAESLDKPIDGVRLPLRPLGALNRCSEVNEGGRDRELHPLATDHGAEPAWA